MPNTLYEFGICPPAQGVDQLFPLCSVISANAQLDQLVSVEGHIELGEHAVAEPGGADAHHRIEMVGPGAQGAALFSR